MFIFFILLFFSQFACFYFLFFFSQRLLNKVNRNHLLCKCVCVCEREREREREKEREGGRVGESEKYRE